MATNADDNRDRDALGALQTRGNTGQLGSRHGNPGFLIALSRR
jgi:hypothetical protein